MYPSESMRSEMKSVSYISFLSDATVSYHLFMPLCGFLCKFYFQPNKIKSNKCLHKPNPMNKVFCVDCGKILKNPSNRIQPKNALKLSLLILLAISSLFIQVPVFNLNLGVR